MPSLAWYHPDPIGLSLTALLGAVPPIRLAMWRHAAGSPSCEPSGPVEEGGSISSAAVGASAAIATDRRRITSAHRSLCRHRRCEPIQTCPLLFAAGLLLLPWMFHRPLTSSFQLSFRSRAWGSGWCCPDPLDPDLDGRDGLTDVTSCSGCAGLLTREMEAGRGHVAAAGGDLVDILAEQGGVR